MTSLGAAEVDDVNKTDVGADVVEGTSDSDDTSSVFRPDRDVGRQAYQSDEGWQLKYHDIKTRRDAADNRAKARRHVFCVMISHVAWLGSDFVACCEV